MRVELMDSSLIGRLMVVKMSGDKRRKIIIAFYLGYSISLLKDFVHSLNFENSNLQDKEEMINKSSQLLNESIKDYEELLGTKFPVTSSLKNRFDFENYVFFLFDSLKDQLQLEQEKLLEISFLVGSLITMSGSGLTFNFDSGKFALISFELMNVLGIRISWHDFEKIIEQLRSREDELRVSARNQLMLLVVGQSKDKENELIYQMEEMIASKAA